MSKWGYDWEKYCRWCGKPYKSPKSTGKPGCCSNACRQAHHRAYQKYVTQRRAAALRARGHKVTVNKTKNIITTRQKKRKR